MSEIFHTFEWRGWSEETIKAFDALLKDIEPTLVAWQMNDGRWVNATTGEEIIQKPLPKKRECP